LQMKHGMLVPTLHAATPNSKLDLGATPFRLQTELRPWAGPRIAGVSSFGAGGANAHVVLEAWPSGAPQSERPSASAERRVYPVVLSARDPERLRDAVARLLAVVERSLAVPVADQSRVDVPNATALRAKLADILD